MTTLRELRRGALLAGVLFGLGASAPSSDESASSTDTYAWNQARTLEFAGPTTGAEPVTLRDVAESNAKVQMAYGALMAMWTSRFEDIGASFVAPQLLRYRGTVRTSCGVMPQDNASYCAERNAIFFDEVFIAAMAKRVGTELGTDGDMAAVGVIAHEVGHAVAIQLGYASRFTYANEAAADCLAGAFALQSQHDGSLEKGDIEEAFLGMALAGDEGGGGAAEGRLDERTRARAALMSHGTREQRMQNFRAGLERGAGACLEPFAL